MRTIANLLFIYTQLHTYKGSLVSANYMGGKHTLYGTEIENFDSESNRWLRGWSRFVVGDYLAAVYLKKGTPPKYSGQLKEKYPQRVFRDFWTITTLEGKHSRVIVLFK